MICREILLGSDLPLFNIDSAIVSVQLRDLEQSGLPTSSTWLDIWLNNVLCNVSAVVVCYHKNGLVKGYQMVRTEDIPTFISRESNIVFRPEELMGTCPFLF